MTGLFVQPVSRGIYWKPTIMTGGHYHCTSPHVFVDETGTFDHGVGTWCGFFFWGCLEMGYWTYASFSQSHFASFLWAFWHDTSFGYGTEHMVYQSAISTLKGQYGKTLEFRGVPILYTNNTNTYLVIFVGVIRLINQEFLQNIPIDFHPYSHPPATMLCSCRKFAQWWYQWSGPSSTWG